MKPYSDFSDALRTADGILDAEKLVARASFPLFILKNESYLLRSPTLGADTQASNAKDFDLLEVSFCYISPSYTDYDQTVVVASTVRKADSVPPFFMREFLSAIKPLHSFMPKGFELPVDWGPLKDYWDFKAGPRAAFEAAEFLSEIKWTIHIAGELQFNVLNWREPMPFSMAYSGVKNGFLAVAAAGTPHTNFLAVLSSLVCVQDDEDLIGKLQNDLAALDDAMKQQYGQG